MKILVTGASGFVGQALCRQLVQEGQHEVVAAVRSPASVVTGGTRCVVGDIGSHTAWEKATEGADAVVHLAGRAHIMHDTACDRLAAYRAINTEGTLALARRALASGVKRLLFVSSIKVCGEGQLKSSTDPYNEASPASPSDAYAISKWEGELGLWAAAKDTGLEVVVLRPPADLRTWRSGQFPAPDDFGGSGLAAALRRCSQSPGLALSRKFSRCNPYRRGASGCQEQDVSAFRQSVRDHTRTGSADC